MSVFLFICQTSAIKKKKKSQIIKCLLLFGHKRADTDLVGRPLCCLNVSSPLIVSDGWFYVLDPYLFFTCNPQLNVVNFNDRIGRHILSVNSSTFLHKLHSPLILKTHILYICFYHFHNIYIFFFIDFSIFYLCFLDLFLIFFCYALKH